MKTTLDIKTTSIRANQAKSSKPNLPNQEYQTEQNIPNQTKPSKATKTKH